MQLLLIRHSITAGNLEHRYIGCGTAEIGGISPVVSGTGTGAGQPDAALPADGRDLVSPCVAENRMGTTGVRFRSVRRKKLSGVVR